MTAPPAEGSRVDWEHVPEPVRQQIEPARVLCADGTRGFVKAASTEVNPDAPRFHRQEARVTAGLEPLISSGRLAVPRLRATVDDGPWFALILDDIDGQRPSLPWQDEQIRQVLGALDELADVLTPTPISAPTIAEYLGAEFTGWRTLAGNPHDERLDSWSRAHLAQMAALEATWEEHASGETLLHADVRADNLLMTPGGVVVVDWPHACVGAAFVDIVAMAPSVAMQGGPEPATFIARSRAGRAADQQAVAATVCALSGYFTERSLRPPPPGLPTVRAFQAAQARVARRWLAQLL